MERTLVVPEPSTQLFTNGISHPELFLWDAWSYARGDKLYLFCLAINRRLPDGSPLDPAERNNYCFHIRQFCSTDNGVSWKDLGDFQRPSLAADGHDARNVWSGSVLSLNEKELLAAYTGIKERGEEKPFLQNLGAAIIRHGDSVTDPSQLNLLSCPERDYDLIRSSGYYIDSRDSLGSAEGEEGGPILAWRDPYIFNDASGALTMAVAAKTSSRESAIGLATLKNQGGKVSLDKLLPPVSLPDAELFTQFELPKIYYDASRGRYLLLGATTTRQSETQSDSEVEKCIRLYYSDSLTGQWIPGGTASSAVEGLENLFGMTALKLDEANQCLHCIAPFTEAADEAQRLTFANKFIIEMDQFGVAATVCANR